MTIDSIVEGDLSFVQKSGQKKLPASVEALIPDAERRKVLQSLAPYSSDTELYSFAKEMSAGRLELSLAAGVVRRNEKLETDFQRVVSIPASAMEEGTLRETAPYFSKALGGMIGGDTEPGLRRIAELMRCPECGEGMRLETDTDNRIGFVCPNGHCYSVVDGVVNFGTREIPGEQWSLFMKNYEDYLVEQRHPGNPRYQMGTVPCSEVRWQAVKKLRPHVILDIACGTCNGLKYDLQRINWPCLVIMTDLSHRILK